MKKCLFIIICCLFLCSCKSKKSWDDKLQISTLKLEDNYIVGDIKNVTNKAYDITINLELKSGTLTTNDTCYETIKPNETKSIECIVYNVDDTYAIKVKNIELNEFEIPVLNEGIINSETFKYHFEDIYNSHLKNFVGFNSSTNDDKYPYIEKIEYKNSEIEISGTIHDNSNMISYYETYNTMTDNLTQISFYMSSEYEKEFIAKIATKISLMKSLSASANESLEINKILLNTDINSDECAIFDEWCISPNYSDYLISFVIRKRH